MKGYTYIQKRRKKNYIILIVRTNMKTNINPWGKMQFIYNIKTKIE